MADTSPFDFVTAINKTKEDLFETKGYTEKEYVPFVVNKTFSNFPDTIFIANEANAYFGSVPNRAQFLYYLNIVEKGYRFRKMPKSGKDEKVEMIIRKYKMSRDKAYTVVDLIPEERYKEWTEELNATGGRRNDP